jgi:hypothetical protein
MPGPVPKVKPGQIPWFPIYVIECSTFQEGMLFWFGKADVVKLVDTLS